MSRHPPFQLPEEIHELPDLLMGTGDGGHRPARGVARAVTSSMAVIAWAVSQSLPPAGGFYLFMEGLMGDGRRMFD